MAAAAAGSLLLSGRHGGGPFEKKYEISFFLLSRRMDEWRGLAALDSLQERTTYFRSVGSQLPLTLFPICRKRHKRLSAPLSLSLFADRRVLVRLRCRGEGERM
ncbi:hypothetical protein R5R35_014169 [Gryllus longicercus]|uniref:Uncharacterized protein n=1 Tax=Gryllus longicercus TaxID=2509291 RepID=A0AAN9UZ85_9ORTH